jgi:hypothetical protein
MCTTEGAACTPVTGVGGTQADACELLKTAGLAQLAVGQQFASTSGTQACPGAPRIAVQPETLKFGDFAHTGAASQFQPLTVSNVGKTALTISSIRLAPGGSTLFDLPANLQGMVLAPLESQTFNCSCSCARVSVGQQMAILKIESDAENGPSEIQLIAEAIAPQIDLDNRRGDFERMRLHETKSLKFIITNPGKMPLGVHSIKFERDTQDFKIKSGGQPPAKLRPTLSGTGANHTVTINCCPSTTGARAATLVIHSDAANEGMVKIPLFVEGVEPRIAVDFTRHDFGKMRIDKSLVELAHATEDFNLTNPGTAPLLIKRVKIEGKAAADFKIVSGGTAKTVLLDPGGAAYTIKISCLPKAVGTRKAHLIIESDAANETGPLKLELSVEGVVPQIRVVPGKHDFKGIPVGLGRHQAFKITNPGTAPLAIASIVLEKAQGKDDDTNCFSIETTISAKGAIAPGATAAETFFVVCRPVKDKPLSTIVCIRSDATLKPVRIELTAEGVRPTVHIKGPRAVLYSESTPASAVFDAIVVPEGGDLTWTIEGDAFAEFDGGRPGNVASVRVRGRAPGTAKVKVEYEFTKLKAEHTEDFYVVDVKIKEGASLTVLHEGYPRLQALGQPPNGKTTWRALKHTIGIVPVVYKSQSIPVVGSTADLVTKGQGRTTAIVDHTVEGVTATAQIEIDVRTEGCSQVAWQQSNGRVACVPPGPCLHEDTTAQQPHATVPTVAPGQRHHHGAICKYCSKHGRPVHHYINSDSSSAAVVAVIELHNEIHALRQLIPDEWSPGSDMPRDAACYLADHPWLQNIPVWLFNPAGWHPPCRTCKATGTQRQNCSTCSGSGLAKTGSQACPACRGDKVREVPCDRCKGAKYRLPKHTHKMIGVLVGTDRQGNRYRLRAVSGSFAGTSGAPTVGNLHGAPNPFWCRKLDDSFNIPSATRGFRSYHQFESSDTSFGQCAAAHLLCAALYLGLEIDSMAEMWIGGTKEQRVDGQLQASCGNCRIYFEHLLCDAGALGWTKPYSEAEPLPNRGRLVTITGQPVVCLAAGSGPAQRLTAVGQPGTGNFTWVVADVGVAKPVSTCDSATLDVCAVAAGTTNIDVDYLVAAASPHAKTAKASVTLHVIAVALQGESPLALKKRKTIKVHTLDVKVFPAEAANVPGAKLSWKIENPKILGFVADPQGADSAEIKPTGKGTTRIQVTFSCGGATTTTGVEVTVT